MVAVRACPGPARLGPAGHHERAPVAAAVALLALLVLGWPLAGLVAGATTSSEASQLSPAPAAAGARVGAGGTVHVVQPGETYWSIAERLGRPGDLRPSVDALVAANGDRELRAGDRLVVPMAE